MNLSSMCIVLDMINSRASEEHLVGDLNHSESVIIGDEVKSAPMNIEIKIAARVFTFSQFSV